ncbi:MAG: rhodanese-like domain-containing protein [Hyphomicrobiaceae bacterium]
MTTQSHGVRGLLGLWVIAAIALAGAALPTHQVFATSIATTVDPAAVPKDKQTKLGLYLTSREAYNALQADPKILFIDVRTRAEFSFVGHPMQITRNIPHRELADSYDLDPKRKQYKVEPNVDYPLALERLLAEHGRSKTDPIFVICRSGDRSRMAADFMADLGYTQVYNVIDGVEGDKDKATGHRTVNGWKNSGLPWTYDVTPERAYVSPSL